MFLKNYKLIAFLLLVSTLLFNFDCKKIDPYGTPQETLRTFVKAYNDGDKELLRKCGQVDRLLELLTYEDDHAGLIRYVPIEDLELSIISCDFQRPDLTKRFTTDKAVVKCEFTSITDRDFYLKQDISIAKKRHSFQDFSETSRWQIMRVIEQKRNDNYY